MKYNCDTWLQSYMAETVVRNTVKELYFARACWLNNFNNNSNFNANNRNVNNGNGLRGIAQYHAEIFFKMFRDLWNDICSYDNLFLAYKNVGNFPPVSNWWLKTSHFQILENF